jgi:signal transduction histidine kinase
VQKTVQHVAQLKAAIDREKRAKAMLRSLNQELEARVQIRTAELEATNEALKISNAELDAFAHTVAHDLKGPLSILSGFAELLMRDDPGLSPAEYDRVYGMIHRASKNSIKLVDELLLLASVRKDEVILDSIDTGLIISEARARLAAMIMERQGQIEALDDWPAAMGYAAWVEVVWVNYISNGLKYGGNPPHLTLGASPQPDGMICFWVKDNGPGLSPQAQTRLFTEFTRLDKARADGHGLGLSIVKRIVEKLGGQVGVKSTFGQGSTFYFTLSAAAPR